MTPAARAWAATALLAVLFAAGLAGIACQQRRALRESLWPQPADASWQVRDADGGVPTRLVPQRRAGLPLAAGEELRLVEEDGPFHKIETLIVALELEAGAGCELSLRDGAARLLVPPDGASVQLFTAKGGDSAREAPLPTPAAGRLLVLRLLLKGPVLAVDADNERLLEAPPLAGPPGLFALRAVGGVARVVRLQAGGLETNQPGGWQRFMLQAGWQPPEPADLVASDRRVALAGLAALLVAAAFLRALCAGRPWWPALLRGALLLGVAGVAGALPALFASLGSPESAEALPARWWDARGLLVPGVLLLLIALPLALRGLAPHVCAPEPAASRLARILAAARALGIAVLLAGSVGWVCAQDALAQMMPHRAHEFAMAQRAAAEGHEQPGPTHLDLSNSLVLPGPWRDGELSARVTLQPGAILGVRVRAPDPQVARGLLLLLSTDARLPSGWRREDTMVFEPEGEPAGALPAGRPLELRITMRGRSLLASIDGAPLAAATDEAFAGGSVVLLAQRGAADVEALTMQPQPCEPVPQPAAQRELASLLPAAAVPALALLLFALAAAALLRRPWLSLLEPAAFACLPFLLAQWGWREEGLVTAGALRWSALGAIALLFLVTGLRTDAGRRGRACLLLLLALVGAPVALHAAVADDAVLSDVRESKARYADWSGERLEEDLLDLTHPRLRLFNDWLAQHQLRSGSHTLAKPADVQRVLVLGASCTWGYRLPPDQHLEWPAVMAARLGPGVEVLNGGFIGAPGFVLLHSFRDALLAYDPDVLVLSLYFADAYALAQADEPAYYAAITAPDFSRSWLFDATTLASLAPGRARYERLMHTLQEGGDATTTWDGPAGDASPPARFRAELADYVRLCAAHNIRLVLVLEPLAADAPSPFKTEFVQALQDAATQANAPFVDPRPALATAGGERLFFDPVHPNAAGHAVLAREILPAVRKALEQR